MLSTQVCIGKLSLLLVCIYTFYFKILFLKSKNGPTLESINKTCSVVRNCPLGYKYTPKGACCPICECKDYS